MPISRTLKRYYPDNWPEISEYVRFERAGGRCERCKRPHGARVLRLSDGRWFDRFHGIWRDGCGVRVPVPPLRDIGRARYTHVILAACHRNHDPSCNDDLNLMALCQRCHLSHDRSYHMARRRMHQRMRTAHGDLFAGPYFDGPGWSPLRRHNLHPSFNADKSGSISQFCEGGCAVESA